MRYTEMTKAIVLAFQPRRRPAAALAALVICLTPVTVGVVLLRDGGAAVIRMIR